MIPEIFIPNYDGTWKETMREFLKPMLKSVLPELYEQLNLDEPPEFLDTELESLAHELSSSGVNTAREVDLLVDLPLKSKAAAHKSVRILLHCEVQGRGGKEDLNFRMYRYKNLLELRYNKPVVALAIITEPLSSEQMSGEYRNKHFGTESIYRFNVLKVFEAREELKDSDNPFDMAQLATARAWRAKDSEATRLEYLKEFVKLLNGKNWNRDEKFKILKFLEAMSKIRTPESKQNYLEFVDTAKQKEKKEEEPMLLMIEERAIKQGMTKGRAEGLTKGRAEGIAKGLAKGRAEGEARGKLETARKLLAMGVDFDVISKSTGLTEAQIRA